MYKEIHLALYILFLPACSTERSEQQFAEEGSNEYARIGYTKAKKQFEGFEDFVRTILQDWKAPGVAVAIIQDGEILLSGGFGLRNMADGLSVAVRLLSADEISIVAPCGLSDLFNMILRRNPRRVTQELFIQRLHSKQILRKWPRVQVIYEN